MGSSSSSCSSSGGRSVETHYREDIRQEDSQKDVRVVYIYIAFCRLGVRFNHWSVILELSNGQFACIQKIRHSFGNGWILIEVDSDLRTSVLRTCGDTNEIRTHKFSAVNFSWKKLRSWVPFEEGYNWTYLNCQKFADKVTSYICGKEIDSLPCEDGPTYYR
ncbi:hypothetical protein PPL_00137 [Heterostelium album PN500]|uniref:Uncharacterized protein n=1 Tax=Heterostelium pallidum (strain ATCC 26659 / Pp 5 / PN500) TaxID=670386 RepID=D3AVM2_HETP5|nr:hypothetical protein PPL_00137 [Heterostelium album PN500]EFA86345.1 hypothetical protein PPL_00137 [Heterostelium album PN500]|eukprot:XP_020438450.1 hypothetical protein PPL_00137 [Heterostelium album PN500]